MLMGGTVNTLRKICIDKGYLKKIGEGDEVMEKYKKE